MYEQTKYELNRMLNCIPQGKDTIIRITRTGGDSLTFYQYERHKIRLFDDHMLYYKTEDKPIKIMYRNIQMIQWEPVFKDKNILTVIDGDFKTKKTE